MAHPSGKDIGREQAYRAEHKALDSVWTFRLFTAEEARTFTRQICGPDTKVEFRYVKGRTNGGVAYPHAKRVVYFVEPFKHEGQIKKVALCIILHEAAHVLTPGTHHGEEWKAAYVSLVKKHIGPDDALRLRKAFDNEPLRVKRGPSKKWTIMVNEQAGERFLFWCPSNEEGGTRDEDWAVAEKFKKKEGEVIRWSSLGGGNWEAVAVKHRQRVATPEEVASIRPADRAALRRGVILWRGSSKFFARVSA